MNLPATLFGDLPADTSREHFDALVNSSHVRIERIVSHGHKSPTGQLYEQERSEWVAWLSGQATLEFVDRERMDLTPGDFVLTPAQEKHRVAATSYPAIWLTVHFE